MPNNQKILVIGSGIGGTAVCHWLQRYGFKPTLIEKAPSIRNGGQPLDIRGIAIDVVKQMGIYDQICEMRTRLQFGRHVDTKGNLLHEEQGERVGFRQDNEVEIIRGDLVELLAKTIADVPCRFNQFIDSIKQSGEFVEVHFKDGSSEQFDLVISADGIHSATRRMVFDKSEYDLLNLGAYISIYSIPNYLNLSHTEMVCENDHKLASITSDRNPEVAQAGFMFRSQKKLQNIRDENEQMQFLRDSFRDFGWEIPKMLEFMEQSKDFYFDAIEQVRMPSWSKGRVALLGDAGYCATPLSGQGNNLALVGAYILAGELKAANGDYVKAFNRYNELLRPFVTANQEFGVWVSETFLLPDEGTNEILEARNNDILVKMKACANAITLPRYA